MAIDHARTIRGALAGAIAAGTWAALQPLDKAVFRSRYDDVELLGKMVTRDAWQPVGLAMHLGNGALFGAAYAHAGPLLPLPRWSRGPAVALAEHLASWPLVGLTDRFHPARKELPKLGGDRRAFAQAAFRHLLFGVVLGELERRANPDPDPGPPVVGPEVASTNGHGSLEHMAAGSRS